jgi:Subtilase family
MPKGFGSNDKIDPKMLEGLGNVDDYVKPLATGVAGRGQDADGGRRAQDNARAPGGDKAGGRDDHAPRLGDKAGPDDKLDLRAVKNGLDAGEFTKYLDAGASSTGGLPSDGQRRAQDKTASPGAEKAEPSAELRTLKAEKAEPSAELTALKAEKTELKGTISELKAERQDVDTKAERQEIKADIKELKNELKDVKQAIKAAKDDPAAEAAASNNNAGREVQAVATGTYASREVLALGLSPKSTERVRALGFQVSESALEYGGTTLRTLFVPDRMDALEAIRLLRNQLASDSFHLNRLYRPYVPSRNDDLDNDVRPVPGEGGGNCRADRCYSRAVMHWSDDLSKCTRDIKIGVIDTEVDLRHPTFAGRKIVQKTFLGEGRKTSPDWHGTGILALLAGRPDSGTPGLVPEANFFVASSFFADESGAAVTDTVALLRSLEWMGASDVKVINMSFAGPDDVLVQGRLKVLRSKGFVFTAAAGNDGPVASPSYPAAYPEVVAVTAVTKDLRIYPSANRGDYIDLAAPGVRIWTALPGGKEGYRTGTSFAAPFATALLALQRPDVMSETQDELLDNVTTVPLGQGARNPVYGRGLVQAPTGCPGPGTVASRKAQQ